MLSQTTYSDISLWFKTAGAQVTPATCTPKVEPQNIDKPSEKDEEFIRLYVERLAKYLGLNNTAHSEALATVVQSCLSIIMNDDGKDYSVIEEYVRTSCLHSHYYFTYILPLCMQHSQCITSKQSKTIDM